MSLWGNFLPEMVDHILKIDFSLIELGTFLTSSKRIGPHNKDILEFIHGSLLGDGFLETHGNGARLCLQQESSNKSYLLWSHKFLADRGYCNPLIPQILTRIGNRGKLRYVLRINSWTYSSFNSLHKEYYLNNKKILPNNYILTPFILAIWIKDNGSRSGKALKLRTNNFTYEECSKLKDSLMNYNLKVSIHKTGVINQYNLYIHKDSKNILRNIIKQYIHPSKKYKLSL